MGQGVAGFGVSVLSFVTIWWAPSSESGEVRTPGDVATAACAYFGVSAAVIAASIAGYWALQRLPLWRHYSRAASMAAGETALLPILKVLLVRPGWGGAKGPWTAPGPLLNPDEVAESLQPTRGKCPWLHYKCDVPSISGGTEDPVLCAEHASNFSCERDIWQRIYKLSCILS